jgi:hypothetical protein
MHREKQTRVLGRVPGPGQLWVRTQCRADPSGLYAWNPLLEVPGGLTTLTNLLAVSDWLIFGKDPLDPAWVLIVALVREAELPGALARWREPGKEGNGKVSAI